MDGRPGERVREDRVIGVMATQRERNWTANIVIASDHAGLKPEFLRLQTAIYHALARIDDARDVALYLRYLRASSAAWLDTCMVANTEK